jgi:drug/metabolite transporter (DMT)-like permease
METVDLPVRRLLRHVEPKTVIFLFVMVMTGSLGSVFLRVGMRHDVIRATLDPVVLLREFRGFVSNAYVWLGIACCIVSGLAFMVLLSWADYSYVNPAASSAYIITVFFGWLLLGEVVPTSRWTGTALITLGVLLIGLTPARTTGQKSTKGPHTGTESPTPN